MATVVALLGQHLDASRCAHARVQDRVQALRAGFQVHVPRPIEPIELVAFVARLAGRTGA